MRTYILGNILHVILTLGTCAYNLCELVANARLERGTKVL